MLDVLSSPMTDLRALAAPLLILAALFVTGATLATFLPTSSAGASCGTWLAPAWPADQVAELNQAAQRIGRNTPSAAGRAQAIADGAAFNHRTCDGALGNRQTLAVSGLTLGTLSGVLGVTGLRRRRSSQDLSTGSGLDRPTRLYRPL